MLLKSLELQGYKTFAGRTAFEFAGTITCVVGPNGSGKSNIADAIRWVLGEQSYSLLRGKKTEDMIFSGSEQRSRASMASATILFDNSNSWLPIDFSEVAITRRAYRDGNNEYLLNGQRVRLRDISELLGKSGLSERTYTIIGQGLVDAALALRADERRRLFEEAAGIGLYRSRREEAQKRLETTRRNLERVEDILAELKPRLRSLERQARRAQEYEQVKADLQLLLREWYGYHWYRAQSELRNARQAAQVQETMLEAVRQEQQDLDGQLAAFRERSQALRAQLGSWHRELSGLHQRREGLTRSLAVADERTHSLQTQQQNASSERTRLEQQASAFQERLSESQQQVDHLKNELEEARVQVEQVRSSLAARQAEREQVEHALREARQQVNAASNQQVRLQARQADRQSQLERQQAGLQAATQSVSEAQQALGEAESRLEQAAEAQANVRSRRQAAEQAVQVHHQQVEAAEVARRQALEQRAGQQAEQARLQAQLEVLDQAEKALAGYASGTRLLLKSAQQGQLKGIRGALAGQLDVPEAYETAIAAALGEYLDAVLLDETHTSDAALELLLNETTRGVLLPLPELAPMAALQPKTIPGLIGLAADLVKAPAQLRPAVDLLLGQTLVVTDRKSARQVLAGQLAGARAVTLRGEVFHASGQILAGQGGQASSLSRPRQRREIREKLDQLEKQLAETRQRLTTVETRLHDLRAQEKTLEQALDQARRQEKAASEAHDQLVLSRDRARRQVQWQQEQLTRLEQELATGEQELRQLGRQLQTLETQLTSAQEVTRQQQAQLHDLSLQDYQEQIAHWNTQIAVNERGLANARSQQQERQAAFSDAHQNQQQLEQRLAALTQDLQDLEKKKQALKSQEVELASQVDELRALIDPAESELAEVEAQHDQLQLAETKARQALSTAERQTAQAQVNLSRRQEQLSSMQEKIEDDFGLVAFEYDDETSGPTPLPLSGLVEQLPRVEQLSEGLGENIKRQRAQMRRMGAINPEAQAEYKEVQERFTFMTEQVADLHKAEAGILEVITELDVLMEREFRKTFDAVAAEFREIFTRLFGGGSARLVLTDPEDMTDTGIDIEARLPGRRAQGLSLLSGGERSLTATALVFALLKVSPTPFCVLDEVDAMLDEANVGRFRDLLRELAQKTQFIVITHNRNTVQAADVIYGVTMGRDSASQVISLKMDEVADVVS